MIEFLLESCGTEASWDGIAHNLYFKENRLWVYSQAIAVYLPCKHTPFGGNYSLCQIKLIMSFELIFFFLVDKLKWKVVSKGSSAESVTVFHVSRTGLD